MNRTIANSLSTAAVALLLLASTPVLAAEPPANDITSALVQAGVSIDSLRALEVGGIVVLRGRATDRAAAEQAAVTAQSLGYPRVANLIQVIEPVDDLAIERLAERRLGQHRGLDGSNIHVDSQNGVVSLAGNVQYELQKDVAMQIVRNIDGVKSVQNLLARK
jgi:osmotically-inducible protein OsmY